MPRFVRPAWLDVTADGPTRGTGPRSRDGWLLAALTLRTPSAEVSPTVRISAGHEPARAVIEIPDGFTVELDDVTYSRGPVTVTIRPL